MVTLSQKHIDEYKSIYKKKLGKDISDDEARKQGNQLLTLFDFLFRHAETELRRERRLKIEGIKGFYLEESNGIYTCGICSENHPGKDIWWDKKGIRCRDCWTNIQNKVIPYLTRDSDNKIWLQDWEIQYDYGIHPSTLRKLTRTGELVGRQLLRPDGSRYHTIYLVKENTKFIKTHPRKNEKYKVEYTAI